MCVTESESMLSFTEGLNCVVRLNISVSLAGLLEMLKPLLSINPDMSQPNRARPGIHITQRDSKAPLQVQTSGYAWPPCDSL